MEAFPTRVRTIRVDSFLNRSLDNNGNPKEIVGRLKPKYRHTIQNAISFSKSKIGMNYDDVFILNNDQYYCSNVKIANSRLVFSQLELEFSF